MSFNRTMKQGGRPARGRSRLLLAALLVSTGAMGQEPATAGNNDPRRDLARVITQRFGGELKGALERAMAEKGPVGAIDTCRTEAPRIAARLSSQYDARVARTALRLRNPGNAPSPAQSGILESFRKQLADGSPAEGVEFFEARSDGGALYMKPIVTAPLCTACHGTSLAPAVANALREHYPRDAATGFNVGDLRGAFLVEWAGTTDKAR